MGLFLLMFIDNKVRVYQLRDQRDVHEHDEQTNL